jgi:glutathione S-transferase
MLKIWGRANSINVQKVLWCCGELGLRYDRIDAGNEFGVTKTPQYRTLNPNSLVPTIEDGDFQLWESNVIVRYLAQKSGDGRLLPTDIRTRFDAERWMDWQATVFWPALRPLFIELIRTPPAKRDATIISRPFFPIVPFSLASPFPWGTFQPRRLFIGGMRWISITPNCPISTDGINS